jgi:hypothetical protein
MPSTISQAEQEAVSAQAFHKREASAAFQAAHARFVKAAARMPPPTNPTLWPCTPATRPKPPNGAGGDLDPSSHLTNRQPSA